MPQNIGTALSSRDNSLNAVRLVLAAAVVLAHSWALGGYGSSAFTWLGANSVNGFFALSGFLIAGSRLRNDFGTYMVRRARRIFPGFWVCLLAVGFVFAPIGGLIGGQGWSPTHSLSYVLDNSTLVLFARDIGDTLAASPVQSEWNRSLWSLMHEFIAYVVCGAALGIAWVRRNLALAAGFAVVALPMAAWSVGDFDGPAHMINDGLRLLSFFSAGVLAYALRDRIPTSHLLAVLAAVVVVTAGFSSELVLNTLTAIPLTYLLLHVGATWRTAIAAKEDVSFGLYIYGWPVQQVLGMLGLGTLVPVPVFALTSLACTFPLAVASWRLVERPAMRARFPAPVTGDLDPAVVTPRGPIPAVPAHELHVHSTLISSR